jgi:hypothetical protein
MCRVPRLSDQRLRFFTLTVEFCACDDQLLWYTLLCKFDWVRPEIRYPGKCIFFVPIFGFCRRGFPIPGSVARYEKDRRARVAIF